MSIPRDPMNPGFPVHPGEMLLEEFMVPLSLTAEALADALHVPVERIKALVERREGIDADLAYRLAIYWNMSVGFWMGLESSYQLGLVYQDRFERLQREVRPRPKQESFAGAA